MDISPFPHNRVKSYFRSLNSPCQFAQANNIQNTFKKSNNNPQTNEQMPSHWANMKKSLYDRPPKCAVKPSMLAGEVLK